MLVKYHVARRTMLGLGCIGAVGAFYLLTSLLGVERVTSNARTRASPVRLAVYYEVLCPDSKSFIRRQLWTAYQAVPELMDVELVPYGKATETQLPNGSYGFQCQHGPDECYGNLVQTCAIRLLNDTSKSLPYINCMESYYDSHNAGRKCARRHDIDYDIILSCVNSNQGNVWQHEMAQKTENLVPPLNFVPWITVNGQYTQKYQHRALRDLLKLVCDVYKGSKPEVCPPSETPS